MCKEGLLKTNISQGDLSLFPLILVLGIISFNRNPKFPHTFLSLKQIRIVSSFKGKKKKKPSFPGLFQKVVLLHPTLLWENIGACLPERVDRSVWLITCYFHPAALSYTGVENHQP